MMRRVLPKYEISGYEESIYGEKNNNKIISYVEQIKEYDEEYLELLDELFENVNIKEYQFIMKSILNRLALEIENEKEEMKENYTDLILRKVLIDSYNSLYGKFIKIRKLYEEKIASLEKEEKPVKNIVNRLFYPALVDSDSFAEKDLKDIPEEKLEELGDLLTDFKYDELTTKQNSQFTGSKKLKIFRKLKGDQIRVMVKNIGGHNYAVAGIFIKKDNVDLNKYQIIASRNIDLEITDEYIKQSEESEAKIFKYIDENKRKGSR